MIASNNNGKIVVGNKTIDLIQMEEEINNKVSIKYALWVPASIFTIFAFMLNILVISPINQFRSDINGFRTEINGFKTEIRSDINGFRTEIRSEINGLRSEINGLKTEINGFKTEIRYELKNFEETVNKRFDRLEHQIEIQNHRTDLLFEQNNKLMQILINQNK